MSTVHHNFINIWSHPIKNRVKEKNEIQNHKKAEWDKNFTTDSFAFEAISASFWTKKNLGIFDTNGIVVSETYNYIYDAILKLSWRSGP